MISRPHLLTGAGVGEYKIYLPGLDLIPCLPNPSYCETQAKNFAGKHAKAERVCAAAKEARELSQRELVRIKASAVFAQK
jgi:hypothetical protein